MEIVRQHRRPLWLAALAAWPAVPLGYALFFAFIELTSGDPGRTANILPIVTIVLTLGLPISGVATFLVGLPVVLLMRSRGWLTAIRACLVASVIGATAWILFMKAMDSAMSLSSPLLLLGAAFGAVSGLVFCLVADIRWRAV
jgi:hypothetical protein